MRFFPCYLAGFADPGPMLRRTLCHNATARSDGQNSFATHNPPESGQIAESGGMSALCQKRTNAPQQKALLFDHLVSGDELLIGHGEAEHPGGLVAGPDVAMQESDGGNPVCSLPAAARADLAGAARCRDPAAVWPRHAPRAAMGRLGPSTADPVAETFGGPSPEWTCGLASRCRAGTPPLRRRRARSRRL